MSDSPEHDSTLPEGPLRQAVRNTLEHLISSTGTTWSPYVPRQMWACLTCKTARQWGILRFAQAQKAAKEADEVIVHEPILWCAGCKNNRPHVWSSDEGVS